MPTAPGRNKVLKLARRPQGVTAREIAAAGIHRQVLTRLVAAGEIERIARGIYRLPGQSITENHGLVVVSTAVPHGVVCLLSALQFHAIFDRYGRSTVGPIVPTKLERETVPQSVLDSFYPVPTDFDVGTLRLPRRRLTL
jgi:predicted transcriptional regulator of viral defense system